MRNLLLAALLVGSSALFALPAQARCSDFASQEEAQAYFNQTGDRRLDRDGDGVACESLPHTRHGGSSTPISVRAPQVPRLDPWNLQNPVLLGNGKTSYYYKRVVLAGDTPKVAEFLNYYNLTVKYRSDYSSARPIWAACQEIRSQTVCVGVDTEGRALDDRIFSKSYAAKVAVKVFGN